MSADMTTTAVQVITWFDWIKLIVPGIVTGFIVLLGAYLAYIFAKRGRKEDILYKERYKSFENVVIYIYDLNREIRNTHNKFSKDKFNRDATLKYMQANKDLLVKFLEEEPSRRNLILLNTKTRKSYYDMVINLITANNYAHKVIQEIQHDSLYDNDYASEPIELNRLLLILTAKADECQKLAFKDVDLLMPKSKNS